MEAHARAEAGGARPRLQPAARLGGNIYFLAKLFSTDGQSFLQAVGTMTGMSPDDYQAMMLKGGRSPDGMRSLRESQGALAEVAEIAAEIAGSPARLASMEQR